MRSRSIALIAAMVVMGCARHASTQGNGGAIPGDRVYTSTRQVTALAAGRDGSLWAGTTGGLLLRKPGGDWRKLTRMDGLPSHEVLGLEPAGDRIRIRFPISWTDIELDGRVPSLQRSVDASDRHPPPRCEATWQGRRYVSASGVFGLEEKGALRGIPLPPSRGSHVSALLARRDGLWAALYGEGLWTFDGARWQRQEIGLPAGARDITALAETPGSLWVGTRRAGVWQYSANHWSQHLMPDEPFSHNAQNAVAFGDKIVISTLEDGLAIYSAGGWRSVRAPEISSDAPRQMAVFNGKLFVRHGGGQLDAWDGKQWELDLAAKLPRKEVSAIATDGRRLYAAQWGGWSEFDGAVWKSRLDIAELQGIPTTAISKSGDTLWIGTQGRGLAAWRESDGRLRWNDARHGMQDDWITALGTAGGTVFAGTFVGGVSRQEGEGWRTALRGENVTAIESDGADVYAATRRGVWRTRSLDDFSRLTVPYLDDEAQCLVRTREGLWVGTRTGITFLSNVTLEGSRLGQAQASVVGERSLRR